MAKQSYDGYRAAVVNPLTLVGEELRSLLRERSVNYSRIDLIDTAGSAEGVVTEISGEAAFVVPVHEDSFENVDVAFFCGEAAANETWIERASAGGFLAIDLAQPSLRLEPPLVAGVNSSEGRPLKGVIVSPHPAAIPLVLLLHAIQKEQKVSVCTATIIQPASESGQQGIEELVKQTIGVLNVQSVPTEVFDRQLAFNIYPALGADETEGYIVAQIEAVLEDAPQISVSIAQGSIFHSHVLSVFVMMEEEFSVNEMTRLLRAQSGIEISTDPDTFGISDAAGRDEVIVGRIRKDPHIGNGFWIWAICDNIRRGSALNAVLIAEELLEPQAN